MFPKKSLVLLFLSLGVACTADEQKGTGGQTSTASIDKKNPRKTSKPLAVEHGEASWYGGKFIGRKKANGKEYRQNDMHIAHKTLPKGSIVRVTNLNNGKSVIVPVEDRGPYKNGRIVDASMRVAEKLGFIKTGIIPVRVEVLHFAAR